MLRSLFFIACIFSIPLVGIGQLQVTPSINANGLAQYLVGPGVSVSNAVLNTAPGAAGFFNGTQSNIGIDSGIVLSSGLITNAVGPNTTGGGTYDALNTPGYPLLTAIAGSPTLDRTELRFDVIPYADTLRFRYVFGSEEYPEYVCSAVNDAFGFFITGPNPGGPNYVDKNVALIPRTNIGVSINSVNPGVAGSQAPGPGGCISLSHSNYYVDNVGGSSVEYDGFTVVLEATLAVEPCSTYTLKVAIADALDRFWNSGVFLQAGSLTATGNQVSSSTAAGSSYTSLIEGCLDGELIFTRTGDLSQPSTIELSFGGNATNGVDLTLIPDSINFAAGQDSVVIPLTAFQDNLIDDNEQFIVYILSQCVGLHLDSTVITLEDSLHVNILPGDTVICIGESIPLQAIGGYNFSWSPPTGLNTTGISTPTATPQTTTTYTVQSTLFSCQGSGTITIGVDSLPELSIPDTSTCIGTPLQINGITSPGANFTWSPLSWLSNPFSANPTFNGPSTMVYTVTSTYGGGCEIADTVTITVNQLPIANAGQNVVICQGDSTQLSGTGGISQQWSPAGSLSNPSISNPYAFPSSSTTYTLTVTDANGCTQTDTKQVGVVQAASINAGLDMISCAGAPVQLAATGGISYQWQPAGSLNNPSIQNPIASPSQTTNFIVTGTDANGCAGSDTVLVSVIPEPVPNIQASATIVCPGDDIQLGASGGNSYQWSPATGLSNPNIANPVATMTQNIVYTVVVTDANGCSGTDSIALQVHTLPTINAGGNDSICRGQSITLAASGGVSYAWSPAASLSNPNAANPVATPNNTTTYTLNVTDANGCQNTDQATITVMSLPIANAGADQSVCEGDLITFNGGGGVTYAWAPGGGLSCSSCPNPQWTASSSQQFVMTAYSAFGCEDNDTVSISVTPGPNTQVVASANGTCPGGSVQLTASGGDTYTWLASAPGLNNYNISNPTATPPTTTTYYVDVHDNSTGCSITDSIEVLVFPLPNVQVTADDTICLGDSKVLQVSGASTYQWSPAGTLSGTAGSTVTATPVSTTQYTVIGTDNRGCENTAQTQVLVNPLPTANAGSDQTLCAGTTAQLTGSGGTSYRWTPSTGLSCSQCSSPQTIATTSRNYILEVADNNGCTDRDTVHLDVMPAPPVNAGPDVTLCPNGTTTLQAFGAVSYTWAPPTGLSSTTVSNPTAAPSVATTYTVTGMDAIGCENKDSVTVDFYPFTPVNAGADTIICEGQAVQLLATNASLYTWHPGGNLSDSTIANPIATPVVTTHYTVNAEDINGCTSSDQIRVTVNPRPNIVLSQGDTTLCVDQSVQLGVSGGVNYSWSPALGLSDPSIANPIAQPTAATVYTVTIETNLGCSVDTTIFIDLYPITEPNAQPAVAEICPGDSLQLSAQNGVTYTWLPTTGLQNSNTANPVASPSISTIYTVSIVDINGCTFTDEVDLTVNPAAIADAGPDGSVFIGDSYQLQGSGNGTYEWTPPRWLDFPLTNNPVSTPDSSTWYTLTVTTPDGCMAIDSAFVRVYFKTVIYMPNAFSPNGDGRNDLFRPKWYNEFDLIDFRIYNRWGDLVYASDNENTGWDGTVDGQPQPIGVYTYIVRGIGNQGEPFFKQGNVTLLR